MDKGVVDLVQRMGLAAGFFEKLQGEDAWSFLIKLHAMFEAACTHLLLFHFQEPELSEVFSRLELSNKTTGKVAFLGRLELLGKGERRFIAALSELRNSLVHDIRNYAFSLKIMVAGFKVEQRRNFTVTFNPWEEHIREMVRAPLIGKPSQELIDYSELDRCMSRVKEDPKGFIWLGAHNVLVSIVDMHGYSDYKQWTRAKYVLFEGDKDLRYDQAIPTPRRC
jgi:hypothetical protein